jgi:hypothetical protein
LPGCLKFLVDTAIVQDALRQARIERRLQELHGMQGYWSRKARDKGILTEQDLERYLRKTTPTTAFSNAPSRDARTSSSRETRRC